MKLEVQYKRFHGYETDQVVENVTLIPRVGDKIWVRTGYGCVVVEEIVWDFADDTVVVKCGEV